MNNSYLNLIYGLLLGESFILKNNQEIKLIIKIEGKHRSYMTAISKKISKLGFCKPSLPKIATKLGKKGKLNKLMVLNTYNNDYYLVLYNKWYLNNIDKNIPSDFNTYFNEQSLAFWLMTEGKISNKKLYVKMKQFNNTDIKFLIQFLENKFKLDKINFINNCLEFNSNNIVIIYNIIKPYILPSMKFKFVT